MNLTPEQSGALLTKLTAGDAIIALQLVTRVFQAGAIREQELATVGVYRNRLAEALLEATGINYDEVVEAENRALREQQAQQAKQEAGPAPVPPETRKQRRKR